MKKGMSFDTEAIVRILIGISICLSGSFLSGYAYSTKMGFPIINMICFLVASFLFFFGIWFMTYRKDKEEKEYYPNGILKTIVTYTNSQRTVIVKRYYDTGILKSETPYTVKKLDGTKKDYYESGKLKCETFYVKGKLLGEKIYDENGNEIK
jgi:hypothetical protein